MSWVKGSTIHVDSQTVGRVPRSGRIVETLGADETVHYRVQWDDGHESIYFPGPDGHLTSSAAPKAEGSPETHDAVNARGAGASKPETGVQANSTLRDVAISLAAANLPTLPVLDGDKPVGSICDHDLVRSLAAGADPDLVWAGDVMVPAAV